jgi:hypothetical protein
MIRGIRNNLDLGEFSPAPGLLVHRPERVKAYDHLLTINNSNGIYGRILGVPALRSRIMRYAMATSVR